MSQSTLIWMSRWGAKRDGNQATALSIWTILPWIDIVRRVEEELWAGGVTWQINESIIPLQDTARWSVSNNLAKNDLWKGRPCRRGRKNGSVLWQLFRGIGWMIWWLYSIKKLPSLEWQWRRPFFHLPSRSAPFWPSQLHVNLRELAGDFLFAFFKLKTREGWCVLIHHRLM